MKRLILFLSGLFLFGTFNTPAQDTVQKSKALCFPAKKWGICLGNSLEFNGIRINFADRNVKRINGLNMTFWLKPLKNLDATVNGLSVGVIQSAGTLNGINAGILGIGVSEYLNGITIGCLLVGGGDMNGLSLSGLYGEIEDASGVAVSGLFIATNNLNGLELGGLFAHTENNANGVSVSPGVVMCNGQFTGVTAGSFVKTKKMNGLSIGVVNMSDELHGIQIGLLNHAANNPKGLRWFPLINLHFGRK